MQSGDVAALERLHRAVLSRIVEAAMLTAFLGEDFKLRSVFEQQMELPQKELAGPNPSALEVLLAERIVLGNTALQLFEYSYYSHLSQGMTPRSAEFFHRCISRLDAMLSRAVKDIAHIRRLHLPAVQVNIGEKQINVCE
jgi:hypothetical protein